MCEELIGDSTIFDCQIRGEKLLFFERAPFHWSTAAAPCRAGFCHTERAGPACTRARPLAEPVPLGQQSALRRAVCAGQRARHSCLLRLRIDGHTRQSDLPVPPPTPSLWCPYVCSPCLCLCFCFANKIIYTIFFFIPHICVNIR